ncbi:KasA/KasB family beta-ketoacyl-ACP synthase [Mycobacterium sp. NPDC048908]|uniref:KasA/KasB family beta-ketoacyl-ACP synthase n=1 Tax=Mycobacterium sp. NPDC048908 TaxID=3364292 RepID=UPI003721AF22
MPPLRTGEGFPNVVVTGVSSTTALSSEAEKTWQLLLEGRSGVRRLDNPFISEFESPVRIGGVLQEDFDEHLSRVELRRLSSLQKMSIVLNRRLWDSAGSPDVDTRRLLVSVGLALASNEDLVVLYDEWVQRGLRAANPLAVQRNMPNGAAAAVGLDRGAKAGVISPILADASGAAAIAMAWRRIVLGEADVAICGGVEAKIEAVPVASLSQSGLLSTNNDDPAGACRPFAKDRDGMVLGEAGALLLVETEEHAEARGAPVLARLMGAAITSDGYDPIKPDPSGEPAGEAIARAIELAGLTPRDVDHINAHATGTSFGDLAEARAIRHALGGHSAAVYASKAALGHSFGATGAVEAVLTVQALRDGVVPATLNLNEPDPEIDLDVVAGAPRRGDYCYAVSNTFGIGGENVALLFGAP